MSENTTSTDPEEDWKDDDFLSFGPSADEPKEKQNKREESTTHVPSIKDNELPPWMEEYTDFRRVSPLVALHNEIVGFCNLMSPLPKEMEERNALVKRFTDLVYKTFGERKCEVTVFGSQATGLCLPTSDIDMVVSLPDEDGKKEEGTKDDNNKGEAATEEEENDWSNLKEKSPLDQLADALRSEWFDQLSYLEVIAKTKVPLVKFTHAPTGLSVDVSFVKETGPQAATLIKTFMEAMPPLRPLIFVLKYFLAARGLNEPYSGGVGSYMLQLMIVSFLQHRERDAVNFGKPGLYNLGCLLVEFFEMYGTKFNYPTTVISVRHDGSYFRKGENKEAFFNPTRPMLMAIENPLDISADVGKASFRISMVQRSFAAAFKVLLAHVATPVEPTVSILATIIPPTEEMVKRKSAKVSSYQEEKWDRELQSGRYDTKSPRRKKRRMK